MNVAEKIVFLMNNERYYHQKHLHQHQYLSSVLSSYYEDITEEKEVVHDTDLTDLAFINQSESSALLYVIFVAPYAKIARFIIIRL